MGISSLGGYYMNFQTISVSELWKMVRRNDVYLIDLRDRNDYRHFHVDGAKNLPYDEMEKWKNMLPKNKKLVLYCEHGSTSMLAAKKLIRMGYQVYTLVGGINALNE